MPENESFPDPNLDPSDGASVPDDATHIVPAPRKEPVMLPLTDEAAPHVFVDLVSRKVPENARMVVTLCERPHRALMAQVDSPEREVFSRAAFHAPDHAIFVHSAARIGGFLTELGPVATRNEMHVVCTATLTLAELRRGYEHARLSYWLIDQGLAHPRGIVRLPRVTDADVVMFIPPTSLHSLAAKLLRLQIEPLPQRIRLLRTYLTSLSGNMNLQQIAHQLEVSTATVRNRLNRIHELVGPYPCSPQATVQLLAVLPALLFLWQDEMRTVSVRS
ncbi:helix-turn-helix domain-containing protein [Nocardioides sp.]|uniref:helix-turn-helix domain-containing protein n=1 Tax=Nocardioides sp. TaxID=35761 RepID=UPI0026213EA4|nr:helix-turn-helix domain-containing protein [Nocardioides sp.]